MPWVLANLYRTTSCVYRKHNRKAWRTEIKVGPEFSRGKDNEEILQSSFFFAYTLNKQMVCKDFGPKRVEMPAKYLSICYKSGSCYESRNKLDSFLECVEH